MKPLYLLLFLFIANSYSLLAQKTHEIQFNGDGLMTSSFPTLVERGDFIKVRVNTDQAFWESRIDVAMNMYLKAIENINKNEFYKIIDPTGLGSAGLEAVKCSLCKAVENAKTNYVNPKNQRIITQKINIAGCDLNCTPINPNIPALDSIIDPQFYLLVSYYNKSGNKIYDQEFNFISPAGAPGKTFTHYVIEKPVEIRGNFYEVKYELRLKNSLYTVIQNSLQKKAPNLPPVLITNVNKLQKVFDRDFFTDYESLTKRIASAKDLIYKGTGTIDNFKGTWLKDTDDLFKEVEGKVNSAINLLSHPQIKSWILGWMWLTQGVPKLNPFDFQSESLFPSPSSTKVTEEEKALLELFERMIEKQQFQITSVHDAFDEDHLKKMASIKARIQAENNANKSPFDKNYDFLLYKGFVKTYDELEWISIYPQERNYMLSHNASDNFIIMNNNIKEVTENDKVFVLLNNKKVENKYKITLALTSIAEDLGVIAEEIAKSDVNADKSSITPDVAANENDKLKYKLKKRILKYEELSQKVTFLTSLNKAPTLPLELVKDETPQFETGLLNYNNQFKAPATAEYSIKSIKGDKEEEVYKGEFRINKLYNLRFKAGLVYSGLTKYDYTVTATNTFTETKEDFGLDGTFGIQIFPKKTDIRNISIMRGKFPPCLYLGLSMKGIRENFYVGTGFEIFSGLTVMYMGHIGRTEQLIGENAIPTGTNNVWKWGNGAAITIDGSLFVNLFKFGANKSLLGIQ